MCRRLPGWRCVVLRAGDDRVLRRPGVYAGHRSLRRCCGNYPQCNGYCREELSHEQRVERSIAFMFGCAGALSSPMLQHHCSNRTINRGLSRRIASPTALTRVQTGCINSTNWLGIIDQGVAEPWDRCVCVRAVDHARTCRQSLFHAFRRHVQTIERGSALPTWRHLSISSASTLFCCALAIVCRGHGLVTMMYTDEAVDM